MLALDRQSRTPNTSPLALILSVLYTMSDTRWSFFPSGIGTDGVRGSISVLGNS